jgi:leucine-zipper of insertion element IS481
MNIHNNARLTPISRERVVMQVASGLTPQAAARAAGVCPRTIRKWPARFGNSGSANGLHSSSSLISRPLISGRGVFSISERGHASV